MADFCVDITQQVEFDEKVVCGLWQCEALRASQKGFVCLDEVRGQPRFETGSLYHFMFVEKGVWHPGSRPAGIYGLTTSWGNPLINITSYW